MPGKAIPYRVVVMPGKAIPYRVVVMPGKAIPYRVVGLNWINAACLNNLVSCTFMSTCIKVM